MPKKLIAYLDETHRPLVINQERSDNTRAEDMIQLAIPGTELQNPLSLYRLMSSDRVVGAIALQYHERDYAYGESEIRLLTTIAGSLGAALENARLFDETQRLLNETEQRAAELQIINSVQAGLATKLDIQSIYELVGEKISEIFKSDTMLVATFDHATGKDSIVYGIEDGKRFFAEDEPFSQFEKHLIKTRKTVVINERAEERLVELGMEIIPGTSSSKSGVWVPLLAGDEVRGMISLQSNHRENAFSSTNVRLLETLANSMSVALENARLFNETQRLLKETEQRAAELAVINSVQAALAAELNMQGIYDTVGDKIREIFHNADVGIRVFDPSSGKVHHVFSYENGKRIDIEPYQLSDKGVAGYVIRTRQTLVVNENILERMEQLGSFILPGTNPEKSGVWVPLIVGDQARGLIELISQEKENAFSQSDVRLLETLANSMSVALENARLFDETQRLLKETEEHAAELSVINSIQQGLAAELDFQAITDLVGDKLRQVLDTREIGIRWFDPKTNLLHFIYEYEHGERIQLPPFTPEQSPIWINLRDTRQPLILNNQAQQAAFGSNLIAGTDRSQSMVAVPIIGSDRVIGYIILEDYEHENAYNEANVRLLQTVASSMGVALENARLFNETQTLLQETEERASELAVINSVQAGLASKLDMRSIFELIGEKTREVFNVQVVDIVLYDTATNLISMPYSNEKGDRSVIDTREPFGFRLKVIESRAPLVINQNFKEFAAQNNNPLLSGDWPKSAAFVPLLVGDNVKGIISIQDLDNENAFNDSDVRLLLTLANSMSVALENAHLFDETQRCSKRQNSVPQN